MIISYVRLMVGMILNENFQAGVAKLQILGIACNSWLQEIEVIGQIR